MGWLTAPAQARQDADAALIPLPSGHYALEVAVNGQGPYLFTLDTAASHSAVIQPLAEFYGFQSTLEDLTVIETLTRSLPTERFTFDSFSFAGVESREVETVVINGVPAVGLSALGLLGTNALEGRRIRIDYRAQRLWVDADAPTHHDGQVDPVFNVLVGAASVAGSPSSVRVLIDTGSAHTIINSALAPWARRRFTEDEVEIGGAGEISDLLETKGFAQLNQLQIGGLCISSVIALEADAHVFRALGWAGQPAMIVGMDVLQDAVVTIDYDQDRFELSPAAGVRQCRGRRVQHPSES